MTTAIEAVRRGMARTGQTAEIDVDVQTAAHAVEAVDTGAHWIMLDNMPVADIEQILRILVERAGAAQILSRASDTAGLDGVRAVAETDVDLVAVGALTRSAPGLDLTMLLTAIPVPCPR